MTSDFNDMARVVTQAQIADAPLAATGLSLSLTQGQSFSGTLATFTDAGSAATANDFQARIDWNDGVSTDAAINNNLRVRVGS